MLTTSYTVSGAPGSRTPLMMQPIQRSRTPALPGAWPDLSMNSVAHANALESLSASDSSPELEAVGGRVAAKHSFLNVNIPSPVSHSPCSSSSPSPVASASASVSGPLVPVPAPSVSRNSRIFPGGTEEPVRDEDDLSGTPVRRPAKFAGTPSTFGVHSREQSSYFKSYDVSFFESTLYLYICLSCLLVSGAGPR